MRYMHIIIIGLLVMPLVELSLADERLYFGFDNGFEGWERTGTVPQWAGYTLDDGIKWYNEWARVQGIIVIDAGYLPRREIDASSGIRRTIDLPIDARSVTFKVVKQDHDGGFRAVLVDTSGDRYILGEQILYGGDRKTITYDISQWAGKTVTLEARAFPAGTDTSGCDSDAGKCCYEYIGIDSIRS
jgi:hypothetical protein